MFAWNNFQQFCVLGVSNYYQHWQLCGNACLTNIMRSIFTMCFNIRKFPRIYYLKSYQRLLCNKLGVAKYIRDYTKFCFSREFPVSHCIRKCMIQNEYLYLSWSFVWTVDICILRRNYLRVPLVIRLSLLNSLGLKFSLIQWRLLSTTGHFISCCTVQLAVSDLILNH